MRLLIKNKEGLTLVEMLIYIAIFSISISAIVSYFLMINSVNTKSLIVSKVESDSQYIFSTLEKNILNSNDIIFPEEGMSSSTLILATPDLTFHQKNGTLFLEESNGVEFPLSSNGIVVSDLEFFISGNDKKNVRITFWLRAEKENIIDFSYKRKYYNSFTIR